MKSRWYFFVVAALAAAFLSGCASSPSKDDVEKAVRTYVGLARPGMGDVKVDEFKILNQAQQKTGNADVFLRDFEVRYTVTYNNHPSKHSFAGTIAIVKQGHAWITMREACKLTFADSPPIAETISEPTTNRQEEPSLRAR